MKKTLSFILVCVLLFSVFQFGAYAADYPEMQVEVHCKSAVLMEASTGRVLMAKDADMQVYPASVTKIMSLLLVTEAIDRGQIALTDTVTASAYASKKGRQTDIVQVVELPVDVEAPVENGQTLGTVIFKLDGEDLAVYTLKAPHSVEKLGFFERWKRLVTSII